MLGTGGHSPLTILWTCIQDLGTLGIKVIEEEESEIDVLS